ncbi:SDR family NAD(P)-dependent oxidoreductase [Tenacibaculum sp. C7A-26P2]|uniref:SDR family NAD(P)-dependent oxidoreductase n=1 Tax=Tenacibaculum sp. C7A-26P2 TaxID=3447504 RepID=UPI003F839F88
MDFNNKTVLIIGGSSGIGLETAKQFIKLNATVIITGSNKNKLISAQKNIAIQNEHNISYVKVDITKKESIYELKKKLENNHTAIDILIITAGIGKFGEIDEISEKDYDLVMNTNVKGTFFSLSALKSLIKKGGNIVLTSSFLTKQSLPLTSVLTASKAAIESFTKIFAKEFSEFNIRVNAISPGSVKTGFMSVANPEEKVINILKSQTPNIPLQKRADVDEISSAILFLASTDARYITGTILDVDGGLSIA